MDNWILDQANEVKFVMVDSNNNEVVGLGSGFTFLISKPGNNTFVAGAGTKTEIGNGWYRYVATLEEADTLGSIAVVVTGAGAVQQNLLFEVVEPELEAQDVWEHSPRTLTSPAGDSVGPTVVPGIEWNPP